MADGYKDIGNPIQLNNEADRNGRITSKLRGYMNKIDLLPIQFSLTIPNPDQLDANTNTATKAIEYKFDEAIQQYQKNCESYISSGKKYSGVRIWTTTDAQFQEDVSNTFEVNVIEDKLNSLIKSGQTLRDLASSVGKGGEKISGGFGISMNNGFTGTAAGAIIEGKHISLPKIWKSSSYSPTLNLNVRLISPYGDSKSIRLHVLEPLVYLLALGSPTSRDGITYGNVGYVRVCAYGISNINLGYIENISIVRGGSDMTFNKYSQPLFVDLNISIKSAFDGFALVEGEGVKVDTIDSTFATSQDLQIQSGIASVGNIIKSFQKRSVDRNDSAISTTSIPKQLITEVMKLADTAKAKAELNNLTSGLADLKNMAATGIMNGLG